MEGNMTFKLDPTLEKDSVLITKLKLCQVRLINNSDFPWVILVPQLPGISEITDLCNIEYNLLNQEIRFVANALQGVTSPDKLNIAMIGNAVSQMHVHIISRYKKDSLFPKPVWGCTFVPYKEESLNKIIKSLKEKIEE
jgi:diadenosine tetraphosphate (Ap4A) HIT family hydrolase